MIMILHLIQCGEPSSDTLWSYLSYKYWDLFIQFASLLQTLNN